MIETLQRCGVNRVSLGVQSFVDIEAASVGRLHKRATVLDDIARLRAAGIENINIDLIAGLPHQTAESWEFSVAEAIATGAPHVSVYMLEVDDDSRLGREVDGRRHKIPRPLCPRRRAHRGYLRNGVRTTECGWGAAIRDLELCPGGHESRHNLKYWTRQPYMGFGVDAHSMLNQRGESARSSPVCCAGLARGIRCRTAPEENACARQGRAGRDFFPGPCV